MESDKPLRLFVNPFAIWTQFALKAGEAMWASAHAAAVRANAPRVAVIPTADAPAPKAEAPVALAVPAANSAPVRRASKAARFKATRAKLRSKANAKRRAKR
ncbi:MAG TPA: hypothetical protein VGP97_19265 [Burkholderiales bacterium]|jgi:hypothetical protein|nr:hypothetical protein [Burkholderiales bacterium]